MEQWHLRFFSRMQWLETASQFGLGSMRGSEPWWGANAWASHLGRSPSLCQSRPAGGQRFHHLVHSIYSAFKWIFIHHNIYSLRSKYKSFYGFQYKLHTNVYRHILECRFTHFASYVVRSGISKKDLYLETEGVVLIILPEIQWTNFNTSTHIYIELFRRIWNILDVSLLINSPFSVWLFTPLYKSIWFTVLNSIKFKSLPSQIIYFLQYSYLQTQITKYYY